MKLVAMLAELKHVVEGATRDVREDVAVLATSDNSNINIPQQTRYENSCRNG